MNSCEFIASITAISCAIAKDKTADEITLLSAIFVQVGDTLATIATHTEVCNTDKIE